MKKFGIFQRSSVIILLICGITSYTLAESIIKTESLINNIANPPKKPITIENRKIKIYKIISQFGIFDTDSYSPTPDMPGCISLETDDLICGTFYVSKN